VLENMAYPRPDVQATEYPMGKEKTTPQDKLLGMFVVPYLKLIEKLSELKQKGREEKSRLELLKIGLKEKGKSRKTKIKQRESKNTDSISESFADKIFNREVDFLIKVASLETKEMYETIFKHLSAILSDYFRQPITPSFWNINKSEDITKITYPFYQFSADLIEVCQAGVGPEVTNPIEKARYQRELEQAQRLLQAVEEIIESSQNYTNKPENTERQHNFIETTASFLSPEIINPLWITPETKIHVGQKMLYIMPESVAHPGGTSIVVLVQPVYIPSRDKWILAHDQYLDFIPWKDHLNLINRFGKNTHNYTLSQNIENDMNPKSSNPEEFIMSHLLTLPEEFSTMDAHSVFKELMPTFNKSKQRRQKMSKILAKKMEPTLIYLTKLAAEYIESENLASVTTASIPKQQRDKTRAFWKRMILSSLFGLENITKGKFNKLQNVIKDLGEGNFKDENTLASLLGTFLPSANKAFNNTSVIECVIGSLTKVGTQGANGNMLNPAMLAGKNIGKEIDCSQCPECEQKNVTEKFRFCPNCGLGNPGHKHYKEGVRGVDHREDEELNKLFNVDKNKQGIVSGDLGMSDGDLDGFFQREKVEVDTVGARFGRF